MMTKLKLAAVTVAAALLLPSSWGGDITSGQIDQARSMANASEVYLTTSNVNAAHFGKLFSRSVDGALFGQPLYVQNEVISGRSVNVVYVATSHNNVYAFDADHPGATMPLWSVTLGPYAAISGWSTGLGVASTPLIVRSAGAIYLTATTLVNGNRVYSLHALDLLTGAEKFGGPVVISGSVLGAAEDANMGSVLFDANHEIQRTGLVQSGNNLVFAFSGDRDHAPYHGWVFSYDIHTLAQTGIFCDTTETQNSEKASSGSPLGPAD
jgi:hypothetical protein